MARTCLLLIHPSMLVEMGQEKPKLSVLERIGLRATAQPEPALTVEEPRIPGRRYSSGGTDDIGYIYDPRVHEMTDAERLHWEAQGGLVFDPAEVDRAIEAMTAAMTGSTPSL